MFENNDILSRSVSSSVDEVIRTGREADLDFFFNASSRVPNPIQFLSTRLCSPRRKGKTRRIIRDAKEDALA